MDRAALAFGGVEDGLLGNGNCCVRMCGGYFVMEMNFEWMTVMMLLVMI